MKQIAFLLILKFAFSAFGCSIEGSGIVVTDNRKVETFNALELEGSANVYLTQGDVQEVKIEAEDNLIDHVTTEVKNGKLIIDQDKNLKPKRGINIYITVNELKNVDLSGSGNISMRSQFNCSTMKLNLMGSGDIHSLISATKVKAVISGSGNIELNGNADSTHLEIDGSGNINGEKMTAGESSVSINGSGNVTIDVKNELKASISGSGDIRYLSEPAHVTKSISGSGKIRSI